MWGRAAAVRETDFGLSGCAVGDRTDSGAPLPPRPSVLTWGQGRLHPQRLELKALEPCPAPSVSAPPCKAGGMTQWFAHGSTAKYENGIFKCRTAMWTASKPSLPVSRLLASPLPVCPPGSLTPPRPQPSRRGGARPGVLRPPWKRGVWAAAPGGQCPPLPPSYCTPTCCGGGLRGGLSCRNFLVSFYLQQKRPHLLPRSALSAAPIREAVAQPQTPGRLRCHPRPRPSVRLSLLPGGHRGGHV